MRSWPGVSGKDEGSGVIVLACDCFVSQGGSEADGTEVRENAAVTKFSVSLLEVERGAEVVLDSSVTMEPPVLEIGSAFLRLKRVKLEAVTAVGSVRSERVAVKVGIDVSLSSAVLLRRPGTTRGRVSSSSISFVF